MSAVHRPMDPAAPVTRFEVGQHITWNMGETRPRAGVIVSISENDSIYCDGTGAGYFPGGPYLGRITHVVCNKHDCHCQGNTASGEPFYHVCNECQLSHSKAASVEVALW